MRLYEGGEASSKKEEDSEVALAENEAKEKKIKVGEAWASEG